MSTGYDKFGFPSMNENQGHVRCIGCRVWPLVMHEKGFYDM